MIMTLSHDNSDYRKHVEEPTVDDEAVLNKVKVQDSELLPLEVWRWREVEGASEERLRCFLAEVRSTFFCVELGSDLFALMCSCFFSEP